MKYYIHNFDGNLIGPDNEAIDWDSHDSYRVRAYEYESESEAKAAHNKICGFGHGGVISESELNTNILRFRLKQLVDSPNDQFVLTWDGRNNYDVQPSPSVCPLLHGAVPILTKEDLMGWCEGDWNVNYEVPATEWVLAEQHEWHEMKQEATK